MATQEIQSELSLYEPAVFLNRVFPGRARSSLRSFFGGIAVLAGLFWVAVLLLSYSTNPYIIELFATPTGTTIINAHNIVAGIGIVSFVGWLGVFMLDTFHASFYFRGLEFVVHEDSDDPDGAAVTYEVAEILLESDADDLTTALAVSDYGAILLSRLNVSDEELGRFLAEREDTLPLESLTPLPENEFFNLRDFALHVYKKDESFKEFLFSSGIQESTYTGALDWLIRSIREVKHDERWWGRDNLGRISGLGREWAYGESYYLDKYAKDIGSSTVFSTLSARSGYAQDKVRELEEILLKSREANALVVGEEGVGKMDIILQLYRELKEGSMMPPLADKRLVVLDTNLLVSLTGEKTDFEQMLHKIFTQAINAGNIILVIEHLPSFLKNVESIGSDATDLIDSYLSSPHLQVIGTATPDTFHKTVESQSRLMKRFDQVQVDSPEAESTIRVLEDIALEQESEVGGDIFFTYQAVAAVAQSAERYLTEGVMPDRAIDLLLTVTSHALEHDVDIVTKETVMEVVKEKTGVPRGAIDREEKQILENLENILHKRVIGQDEAITAVSKALRSARAGVRNPDRPIGSFLFLGPTGVGKTETTKALAAAYFDGEDAIQRVDMSEFSGPDALERLIGSFESDTPGVLSNMVREHPYGVLLLDEFEKADREVHDLFLQILDEGYFSDMRGKKVNLRNMIIIATSNAGSELIWQRMKRGDNLAEAKDDIVNAIIEKNTYRPELLNRFDGIVLFSPLTKKDLREIARIQLARLKERVKEQGYTLKINQALIDLLVKKGYDPKFGARPMNRVIQEDIEEAIANKIIDGQLEKGDEIVFSRSGLPF